MRRASLRALVGGVLFVFAVGPARADDPSDPLRLVPGDAEAFFKVERPRRLVEAVLNLDAAKQLAKIDAVREAADTTNARRLDQLVTFFEKKLGVSRMDLLDAVAGGGVVVAGKYGAGKPAGLLVVRGKRDGVVGQFVTLALLVAEQEMARQESKVPVKRLEHEGATIISIHQPAVVNLHLAAAGDALLASNDLSYLKAALALRRDGGKASLAARPEVAAARKELPADVFAWGWAALDPYRAQENVKTGLVAAALDPLQNFFYGGALDVFLRSPWLTFATYPDERGFVTTFRLPRGRAGMKPAAAVYLPADGKGSLPPLEPKNVVFSLSYHLDLGQFWDDRAKILPAKQLKELEDFDQKSALFLAGTKFSTLLKQVGPHHRVVVTSKADNPLPDFAFVIDMRDPKFGRALETILRGAALIASFQANLKMSEERVGDATLVSYRLPEEMKKKLRKGGPPLDYVPSPCFARVGDHFLLGSSVELGRELVGLLQKESKAGTATVQMRLYSHGGAIALRSIQDQLLTQTILQQALPIDAARDQVETFLRWFERLGALDFQTRYGPDSFSYDIRLILGKQGEQ